MLQDYGLIQTSIVDRFKAIRGNVDSMSYRQASSGLSHVLDDRQTLLEPLLRMRAVHEKIFFVFRSLRDRTFVKLR